MTLQEYQELPKGVKIKIKKFFDKDIITDKYYKVYNVKNRYLAFLPHLHYITFLSIPALSVQSYDSHPENQYDKSAYKPESTNHRSLSVED